MSQEPEKTAENWSSAIREQQEASRENQPPEESKGEQPNIELSDRLRKFLDIPMRLEVVVGSTTMTLGELLQLAPGSVVELEQSVESPVDIKVNGKLVAKGEIVIVEDRFGVRIIDIIGRDERIKGLV